MRLLMRSPRSRTIPYTYDNNGNVTSAGPWAFIWDYRNRLMEVGGSSAATTTHTYDHTNLEGY